MKLRIRIILIGSVVLSATSCTRSDVLAPVDSVRSNASRFPASDSLFMAPMLGGDTQGTTTPADSGDSRGIGGFGSGN